MKTCILKSKQSLGKRKSNQFGEGNNGGLKWKKVSRKMSSRWKGRNKLE